MDDFDDIRPYRDNEVTAVLARLIDDDDLVGSAAAFVVPFWHKVLPGMARWFMRRVLRRSTSGLRSVNDVQVMLSSYFERMIRTTTDGFTHSGIEGLQADQPYLFVSNHRDIAMDSGFINYALWANDLGTSQIAVGDNLFSRGFESDLMRLNKSFVVVRKTKGAKAQYAALSRTSQYIRQALEGGESVWIAQREGRSKDGLDRTEPAILKMFMLAYRKELETFEQWLEHVNLVPVAISYELDPCAPMKARELYLTARDGSYQKRPDEDLHSIIAGITGFKGRVHVAFGSPLHGTFDDAEALAEAIDRSIVAGIESFPTFAEAELRANGQEGDVLSAGHVKDRFEDALHALPETERPYLLLQYANQMRNKRLYSS